MMPQRYFAIHEPYGFKKSVTIHQAAIGQWQVYIFRIKQLPVIKLAANYAKKQKIDDALLLNAAGKIADSTIANLFIVKSGAVYTPALSQGPVAGVMRNWLLLNAGIPVLETALTTDDLLQAEEIWLTNAVAGLRWVEYFEGRKYGNHFAQKIYQKILSLFS